MRPARQSALACSIRSFDDDTKFHSIYRSPTGSPPRIINIAFVLARTTALLAGTKTSISPLLKSRLSTVTRLRRQKPRARCIRSAKKSWRPVQALRARRTSGNAWWLWLAPPATRRRPGGATSRARQSSVARRPNSWRNGRCFFALARQRNPRLNAVHRPAFGSRLFKALGMRDSPSRDHPVDLAGPNRLLRADDCRDA